jgi:DNA-binding XRE family transcriptional regulator
MVSEEWEIRVTNELVSPQPQGTRGESRVMTNILKEQDLSDDVVAGVGVEESGRTRPRNQALVDGHRLAERRKTLGLTQADVAEHMRVPKARIAQIERGELFTLETVARYVQAIGGRIQISAVFGDDLCILRGTGTEAA